MLITLWGTAARRRIVVLAIGSLATVLVWSALEADLWRAYGSRSAIVSAQKAQGYLPVGLIGRSDWPAIVVARDSGVGEVDFVAADGQPHRYQGFAGPMKALHLRAGLAGGKAFTLVFHRPPPKEGVPPVSPR